MDSIGRVSIATAWLKRIKDMNFGQALEKLKGGDRIRRGVWAATLCIEMLTDNRGEQIIYGYGPWDGRGAAKNNTRIYFHFDQKDILAEDWETSGG